MRIQGMTEPASTGAGLAAMYKLGAFGFMAALAAIVVMAMTLPKSPREFVVSMITTVVSSTCGGAFIVRWFDIAHWAADDAGVIAIGGVIFVCGLPAWVIVRAWFAYAEARKTHTLPDIIKEIREKAGL